MAYASRRIRRFVYFAHYRIPEISRNFSHFHDRLDWFRYSRESYRHNGRRHHTASHRITPPSRHHNNDSRKWVERLFLNRTRKKTYTAFHFSWCGSTQCLWCFFFYCLVSLFWKARFVSIYFYRKSSQSVFFFLGESSEDAKYVRKVHAACMDCIFSAAHLIQRSKNNERIQPASQPTNNNNEKKNFVWNQNQAAGGGVLRSI